VVLSRHIGNTSSRETWVTPTVDDPWVMARRGGTHGRAAVGRGQRRAGGLNVAALGSAGTYRQLT